jgi:RNA polymerase sigma factor (sigma-70 family)
MDRSDATAIAASLDEPRAFVAIFERHFDVIGRYLRRRLSETLADELTAEVFMIAFARRASYDLARPDARPWLYGIAANLLRAHARAEERELRALARAAADPTRSPEVAVDSPSTPLEPVLAGVLAGLAPGDREVLLLFAWGELKYEEIAHALELPVGTVKSRLNRTRALVRAAISTELPGLTKEASHG